MQLRLSIAAATLIASASVQAEDYISVQYMQYDENNDRTSISAPSITVNKDFGTDYTLNLTAVADAVSGASPTYYDSTSGASAYSRGTGIDVDDIAYDNVDYDDNRFAGSILFTSRFENRDELILGVSYSSESDFYSYEGSAEYMHWLDSSKNQALSFGMAYQSNEILIKDCTLNSNCDTQSGASQKETAELINTQVSFLQNINAQSFLKTSLFYITEDGYLSSPYHNVVRNYDSFTNTADVVAENRPDKREAYGISLDYANALNDSWTLQMNYRYYTDDWEIDSHTLDTDLYYELGNDWIFKVGLRAYSQSEADFYSEDYFTDEEYASSDERLSDFEAFTYKTGVDYKVNKDLTVNIGANYYDQSTGLTATYFIAGFTYNF